MPKGRRSISSKFAGRLNPRRSVRGWQISGRLPRRSAAQDLLRTALRCFEVRFGQLAAEVPRQDAIELRANLARAGGTPAASNCRSGAPYLTIDCASSAAGWVPRRRRGTVRSRRPRRRADQPKPEPVGLFEQFGGWRPRQPNRVEAKLFQQPQRFAAVLNDPREHRPAIDQQDGTRQLHRMFRRGRQGRCAGIDAWQADDCFAAEVGAAVRAGGKAAGRRRAPAGVASTAPATSRSSIQTFVMPRPP